jgi:hypothetical protein
MISADAKIDSYLRRIRSGLRGLPASEASEILRELRSHITERVESGDDGRPETVESVLQSLGSPEQLAALYVSESLVSRAESSRTPWTILRSLFHWSTLSFGGFVIFIICVIGYTFGVCFFVAAIMKPFHPQTVGLWVSNDPDHFSLHVGGFSGPPGLERELLGWWLVPIGCSLGGGTILLTTQFALWSLRRLRRPQRLDVAS